MEWKKQEPNGPVATEIVEHSVYGQTYTQASGDSVRTVVVADTDHAILTWTARRRVWQYFHRDNDCWSLIADASSQADAKAKARLKKDEAASIAHVRGLDPATAVTVTAEWTHPYHSNRPMAVTCSSPITAEVVAATFRKIGCLVSSAAA